MRKLYVADEGCERSLAQCAPLVLFHLVPLVILPSQFIPLVLTSPPCVNCVRNMCEVAHTCA